MDPQAIKTHTTFPLFAEDLKALAGPIPLSYSISDLIQNLMTNSSSPLSTKLSPLQRQSIAQSQHQYRLFNIEQTIRSFWQLLDDIFYFGLLKDKVELDIRTEFSGRELEKKVNGWYDDLLTGVMERGSRKPNMLARVGTKPTVVLLLFKAPFITDPSKMDSSEIFAAQLRFAIGTMLHEMLHAFLDIFTCKCWKLCNKSFRDPVEGQGLTGHGAKWCEAMEVLGARAQADLGVGTLRVKFDESVYFEVMNSGWFPKEKQIEQWNLDEARIWKARTAFVRSRAEYKRDALEKEWIEDWLKDYALKEGKKLDITEPEIRESDADKAIIDALAEEAIDEWLKEK